MVFPLTSCFAQGPSQTVGAKVRRHAWGWEVSEEILSHTHRQIKPRVTPELEGGKKDITTWLGSKTQRRERAHWIRHLHQDKRARN